MTGFEPATSCSQNRSATKLRYIPIVFIKFNSTQHCQKLQVEAYLKIGEFKMKDFTTYLSTAPVIAIISLTVIAGLLIEINRFFPDALIFSF